MGLLLYKTGKSLLSVLMMHGKQGIRQITPK
ncbi:UNVERIFIED_ORG: hypothetical protein ABIC97_004981 [Peribacillus simplex]